MSRLSKFFQWYHGAPVEGRVVGPNTSTLVPDFLSGHYVRHVSEDRITPGESYVEIYGSDLGAMHKAWGKVVAMGPKQATKGPELTIEGTDGRIHTRNLEYIKKCIPTPQG